MSQHRGKASADYVLHGFQLERHIDPVTKKMTVIACLPKDQLQTLAPVEAHEERLYQMYVCDVRGRLLKLLQFTESDYRQVAQKFIDSAVSDNVESSESQPSQ